MLSGPNTLKAKQIGARRLLDMPDAAGVAVVSRLLGTDVDPATVQAVALAVLETVEPPAGLAEPLVKWLAVEHPEVREAVIAALAVYRNRDLIERLGRLAANRASPLRQRLAAVAVLGRMADRRAVATLLDLLSSPDKQVHRAAREALAKLARVDFGPDLAAWRRWWQANKSRRPTDWLTELNESLAKQNRQLTERMRLLTSRLVKALREVYHATAQAERAKRLAAYLGDPIPQVRLLGIELVDGLITDGKVVWPEAATQLRRLLDDPDSQVRLQTVRVIRDLRNRADAKILMDRFDRETDLAVRQAIVKALGWLGDPAATEVLLGCLRQTDSDLSAAAASALGLLCQRPNGSGLTGDVLDAVVVALKERLAIASRSQHKALRQALLEAMAKIADKRFRPELLVGLKSPEPALRQAAVEGLARLAGPNDAALVRPLLDDPDATVREATCRALASVGTHADLPVLLIRCNEQAEPDAAVRKAAKEAAVSVILRLKIASSESALRALARSAIPASVLVDVLETASARALAVEADKRLRTELAAALAEAKYAAGDKRAAASLWVRVLADRPTDSEASLLVAILIELGEPDRVRESLEQLAGQSKALTDVLEALTKAVQAPGFASRQRKFVRSLPKALEGLDVSQWPEPVQEAFKSLLEACESAVPASAPATAPAAAP